VTNIATRATTPKATPKAKAAPKAKETRSYSPKELAEATGRDPKQIRAYLRKEYERPTEEKNSSWKLTKEEYDEVLAHFKALGTKKEN
jgi:hypothetical protein